MKVIMDVEKSRKFYEDRYLKAIKQFGVNSLTASICKKKLELLGSDILELNGVLLDAQPEVFD